MKTKQAGLERCYKKLRNKTKTIIDNYMCPAVVVK